MLFGNSVAIEREVQRGSKNPNERLRMCKTDVGILSSRECCQMEVQTTVGLSRSRSRDLPDILWKLHDLECIHSKRVKNVGDSLPEF
jgi:hypothetical protein